MQIELPRSKLPYAFPGRRISSAKGHCVSTDDELLGFDVPRRRRTTCTTRPREIFPDELWFLPSSKNLTRNSSPVVEPDEEDEEALIAEALLKIANASGGASDRPRGATTVTGPKRNGYSSSYGGGTNGRTNAVGIGSATSWPHYGDDCGGNGPTKRRRSQELLAGEDDLMATDEADTVHLYDDDMAVHNSNSPQRGLMAVHEEVIPRHHNIPCRSRPVILSGSSPSGRLTGCTVSSLSTQALANGLSHLVQVDTRVPANTTAAPPRGGGAHGSGGRMGSGSATAATASSRVKERNDDSGKPPPPVFLIDGSVPGGIRPLNGTRGSLALFGHSSLTESAPPSQGAHRAPISETVQQPASVSAIGSAGSGKPSTQRITVTAAGGVRSDDPVKQVPAFGATGGDVLVKEEPATGASGTRGLVGNFSIGAAGESASRGATDRERPPLKLTTGPMGPDRLGPQQDRASERPTATAAASSGGGGCGKIWAASGGMAMDAKIEPESNSAPGSLSSGGGGGNAGGGELQGGGDGANGGGGGGAAAAVNGRQAGDSAVTSFLTAKMMGSAAAATGSGKLPVMVMPPGTPGNPLAELLAAAGGSVGPWPQLAGMLPGAASHWALPSAAAAAAAADLVAQGLVEAAGKGGGGAMSRFQPPSGPPGGVLTQTQQLQLQQQQQAAAMLKAAAAAAAVGGAPGLPGTAAAAALSPVCLDYLRALQAGGPGAAVAALGAHPLALQVAAAAAAACNTAPPPAGGASVVPAGLPLAGPVAGAGNGVAAAAGGGGAPSAHGPGNVEHSVPFRRCAQHVYIAHFIAQQQKRQQQRLHQHGISGAARVSSARQQQQQWQQISDPSRTATGSPREVRESPSPAEHSGGFCGGLGGGGCSGARSPNGRCNGNYGTCSNGNSGGGRSQHPSPGGDTSARSPKVDNGNGLAAAQAGVKSEADGAASSSAAVLAGTVASIRNGSHGLPHQLPPPAAAAAATQPLQPPQAHSFSAGA
ncbi:hypothetical protein VaNZ11_010745, partial [Volvox africanus]